MKNLLAKDIMTTDVLIVHDDMTVHELANLFTEEMISGAPVVDTNHKLKGVVSLSDIVRHDSHRSQIVSNRHGSSYYLRGWEDRFAEDELQELHIEEDDSLLVRDIMTPLIFKAAEDDPISEMADTMINGRIHRLIVTRRDKVIGIITTLDMLKAIREYTKQTV